MLSKLLKLEYLKSWRPFHLHLKLYSSLLSNLGGGPGPLAPEKKLISKYSENWKKNGNIIFKEIAWIRNIKTWKTIRFI